MTRAELAEKVLHAVLLDPEGKAETDYGTALMKFDFLANHLSDEMAVIDLLCIATALHEAYKEAAE